jgi:hypothetical protein
MVQVAAPVAAPVSAPEQKEHKTPTPAVKQTGQAAKHHTKEDDADVELAPFDLKLNTDCPEGFKCPNSKKPADCPKNHNFLGPVIKKGTKLPKFFCKWERPWKKGPNGKSLRCRNPVCYNSHLEGRDDFIMKANASPEAQ